MPKKKKTNRPPAEKVEKPSLSVPPVAGDETNENTIEIVNQANNMEAYHPHGKHHPRKFKDYMVEFIMMFIAISGGFFMENLRERVVDRHKEHAYMVRLIRDVKEDTLNIKRIMRINERQMHGLDSLQALLEMPASSIPVEKFYSFTFQYLNNYLGFTPRDITITQLKNSGGLRLIGDNSVADSIVSYYSKIEYFHELNVKMNYRYVEDTYKLELGFFDFNSSPEKQKMEMLDRIKMKELGNRIVGLKSGIGWDNQWLAEVLNQGTSLLHYLEKEYKPEE